ncbi:MAG: serine/threonine protein kinase, partial [Sandaracinaceae bacterium]|nr:serine/threonine protein kinase [Sandaracinaceae bacterium]
MRRSSTLGKYELLREVARGRMGWLYEAIHRWTGRLFHIKIFRLPFGVRPEQVLRDLQASARLVHPHALTPLDADVTQEGEVYVVVERFEGESLAERLRRGQLGLQESAEFLLPISDALIAAHFCGILHLDVRPSNILLAQVEDHIVPKLMDFAVPSLWDAFYLERARPYLAPEILEGKARPDHRSDIWSLATTWLECLTGLRPFERRLADVAARGEELLGWYGAALEWLPSALRAVFARALEPDRRYRWTTMVEFHRALAQALGWPIEPSELPEPLSVEFEFEGSPAEAAVEDENRPTERPPPFPREGDGTPPLGVVQALLAAGLNVLRIGLVPRSASYHDPALGERLSSVLGIPTMVV